MTRNVYLVDDDDAVRGSLHSLLSLRPDFVIRNFRSGDLFLAQLGEVEPGVVLLDFHMPGTNGLDVLRTIAGAGAPKLVTVMLTGEGNIELAVQSMKAGAHDFLEKPYKAQTLLATLDEAFARIEHESAAASQAAEAKAKIDALSPRERDVLAGLISGGANKVIAHELDISHRTVEIYRANMMTKLGVRSLSEALRIAFAAGLISSKP